mmetsp:Transcript_40524/g.126129  ORF Transcript_40524/g.126129 Transcript_40524/m.126129 type:complete len:212 (-) Transcript_40524:1076-1711(-)
MAPPHGIQHNAGRLHRNTRLRRRQDAAAPLGAGAGGPPGSAPPHRHGPLPGAVASAGWHRARRRHACRVRGLAPPAPARGGRPRRTLLRRLRVLLPRPPPRRDRSRAQRGPHHALQTGEGGSRRAERCAGHEVRQEAPPANEPRRPPELHQPRRQLRPHPPGEVPPTLPRGARAVLAQAAADRGPDCEARREGGRPPQGTHRLCVLRAAVE